MASRAIPRERLYDADFLESVQHLRLAADRVPRGGRFAEQRSWDLGHGIEFRDFRPYTPGDDLRGVDWNIYRRLGRVFLRLFEEFEDLPVYLLPDVSESMYQEDPPRALAGLRCALGLAAVALKQHDSVGVFPFADDLSVALRPQSGANRVFFFANRLSEIQPGGRTDMFRSLTRFNTLGLRRGLVVVISDFFDPQGMRHTLDALKKVRHRLLLVQLVRATDRRPALTGDLRLRDCESGAVEEVSVTPAVLERYTRAYDRWSTELAEWARRRSAGLMQLDVEADVVQQLAALLGSGRFVA